MISTAALTFGAGTAFAGAATDVVKSRQITLLELLKQTSPDASKKAAAAFDGMLDYEAISEGSLGAEWSPRSDAEKRQFTDLLKQLVRKAYERNLRKVIAYDISYTGEDAEGAAIIVKTKAQPKGAQAREEPIEIALRVVQKNGKWLVTDIVTEGVSLVSSYRSQFTKIVKKDGFPTLITKMKDKLAKGDV